MKKKHKEMIENGLLNPDSPGTRYTNGGRAYYECGDPFERTLKEPTKGVQDEDEADDEDFEKHYTQLLKNQKMIERQGCKRTTL